MLAALTGLLLGAWHVVSGPDHLAAVAPLAAEDERSGARVGLAWGIGHASAVWLVGLILLAFGSLIPLEALGLWSERVVGLAIVGVGLWGLWRARSEAALRHEHPHGHEHAAPRRGRGSALGIGLVHGFAGGSHLYGVLPALALVAGERVAYLVGFGVGSIAAMAGFAAVLALILRRVPGSRLAIRRWALRGASLVAIVVGVAWLILSL